VDAFGQLGGLLNQAPGLLARTVYSIVLVIVAVACLYEVAYVWFDRSLQLRNFSYVKDGQDVPASGATFARLLEQQQRALYEMYRGGRGGEQEIFSNPLDVRSISLGQINVSVLADVKLEAQGVNIGSLVAALRRGVSSPNEITGTVNQIGNAVYVTALWQTAPIPDSRQTTLRGFLPLSPYPDLQAASFDLACRIFHVQVAAHHAVFRALSEDDFCAFSRASQAFQSYLSARGADPASAEAKKHLELAKGIATRLIERKTTFPYVYKLAAFVQLEEQPLTSLAKDDLDRAQGWLVRYLAELQKFSLEDRRSKERLDFLAARSAPAVAAAAPAPTPPAVSPKDLTRTTAEARRRLTPGASLSPTDGRSAASVCCIVQRGNERYVLTADYAFPSAALDQPVVSPALLDGGDPKKPIGSVKYVSPRTAGQPGGGGIALVALGPAVGFANVAPFGPIVGIAPVPKPGARVRMVGRTSGAVEGKVLDTTADIKMQTGEGSQMFQGMVLIERISKAGDGGAPVVDDHNRLVGLVYGGSERFTMVLPLAEVFDKLGLRVAAEPSEP
jgi:hypothetical protein